jgi:hypothetical protein
MTTHTQESGASMIKNNTQNMINYGETARRRGKQVGSLWQFDELGLSMFVGEIIGQYQTQPKQAEHGDDLSVWLTSCYNQANNITVKNPPLSTDRIFAAMLYMYELGKKETQNSEGL